ncbi:MAG: hypothetical protein H0Z24_05965 [Thermosipho sp. (in: Bacteria)]|nr:hypothetical protein [Thermosipho sp. (in: thermotogales)]
MDSNKNFGSIFYNTLPEVYRNEDTSKQLENFLKVFGEGANFLYSKIYDYYNLFNVDKVPKELLPYLAEMLGFYFPYDIPEQDQRKFIKIIPYLYRLKGTPTSFEYLGRELFGWDTKVEKNKVFYTGEDPVGGETQILDNETAVVKVYADVEESLVFNKVENFKKFAEFIRPINTIISVVISYLYFDEYNKYKLSETSSGILKFVSTDEKDISTMTNTSIYDILTMKVVEELFDKNKVSDITIIALNDINFKLNSNLLLNGLLSDISSYDKTVIILKEILESYKKVPTDVISNKVTLVTINETFTKKQTDQQLEDIKTAYEESNLITIIGLPEVSSLNNDNFKLSVNFRLNGITSFDKIIYSDNSVQYLYHY